MKSWENKIFESLPRLTGLDFRRFIIDIFSPIAVIKIIVTLVTVNAPMVLIDFKRIS